MKPFSHMLAHPGSENLQSLDQLRGFLEHDCEIGYKGMVIVPALFKPSVFTPENVAKVFSDTDMQGLVCGFNRGGDGPDPLYNPDETLVELIRQLTFTREFMNNVSPNLMIGPVHTHHGNLRRDDSFSNFRFIKWMESLDNLASQFEVRIACEPLNHSEDGTPSVVDNIFDAILNLEHIFLHLDTGHRWMLGRHNFPLSISCGRIINKFAYLELVQARRGLCSRGTGGGSEVKFAQYVHNFPPPTDCLFGVEPFNKTVVAKFDLGDICQTKIDAEDILRDDFQFLFGENGLFKRPD